MSSPSSSYRCGFANCEREATVLGIQTALSLCDIHFIDYLERLAQRLAQMTGEVMTTTRAVRHRIERDIDARA